MFDHFSKKREAHPRVCGENIYSAQMEKCKPGSSPRVRGKLIMSQNPFAVQGLIPACAGKTLNDLEF